MPWLAIKLFLGGALKRLSGVFAWATASATRMLAIALCVALLGGIWAYRGWGKEQAGRKADAAAVVKAQADAQAKQDKADTGNLGGQLAGNKKLEDNHAPLEAARGIAVRDYVAAHRLPAQTCSAAGGTGQAGLHRDTGAIAGEPSAPELVTATPADLDRASRIELQDTERGQLIENLFAQGLAISQ